MSYYTLFFSSFNYFYSEISETFVLNYPIYKYLLTIRFNIPYIIVNFINCMIFSSVCGTVMWIGYFENIYNILLNLQMHSLQFHEKMVVSNVNLVKYIILIKHLKELSHQNNIISSSPKKNTLNKSLFRNEK